MGAFNDGTCSKCKRRMGWRGKASDKPPCPYCGAPVTPKELEDLQHDDKIMEEFKEQLRKKKQ
jgi:DNA-directed RNA polymerase subunit RPC12/RpoP